MQIFKSFKNAKGLVPGVASRLLSAEPVTGPKKQEPPKTAPPPSKTEGGKRTYGNISDQDRIFTNLYRDEDPFIKGALKRVPFPFFGFENTRGKNHKN